MEQEEKPQKQQPPKQTSLTLNRLLLKVKYSFYSTLVFLIFANPETLKLLQTALSFILKMISSDSVTEMLRIASPDGLPTTFGLFGMSGLFFSTMLALMLLPSE